MGRHDSQRCPLLDSPPTQCQSLRLDAQFVFFFYDLEMIKCDTESLTCMRAQNVSIQKQ